jgi:hypothetical protein
LERTKLTGRIVTPDEREYELARINNNLSSPKFPRIIVFCQEVTTVAKKLSKVIKNYRIVHLKINLKQVKFSIELNLFFC